MMEASRLGGISPIWRAPRSLTVIRVMFGAGRISVLVKPPPIGVCGVRERRHRQVRLGEKPGPRALLPTVFIRRFGRLGLCSAIGGHSRLAGAMQSSEVVQLSYGVVRDSDEQPVGICQSADTPDGRRGLLRGPRASGRVGEAFAGGDQIHECGGTMFEHGIGEFVDPLRYPAADPAALVVAASRQRVTGHGS